MPSFLFIQPRLLSWAGFATSTDRIQEPHRQTHQTDTSQLVPPLFHHVHSPAPDLARVATLEDKGDCARSQLSGLLDELFCVKHTCLCRGAGPGTHGEGAESTFGGAEWKRVGRIVCQPYSPSGR